jgi:hypothetical protein
MSKQYSIDHESYRQARILFYSATIITIISASVTLLGANEMLSGNPTGIKMILGGLQASINSIRLTKTANSQVKQKSEKSKD